uniref:GRIP domain-containing protein n=1 Tax=Xiphophorus couchianus TaxID=32473 RepID=A0A3B5KQW3_9TELE
IEDHQRKIETLEFSIEESRNKHLEKVTHFQKLLQEQEERDREREKERREEHTSAQESIEEVRRSLEAQLETLRAEMKVIQDRSSEEAAQLEEKYQKELTKAQQEVENLKEELVQKTVQHEEEMKALEEDWEMERNRLMLLTEELTEQLASKGTTEGRNRGTGIGKMLELSGCKQAEPQSGGEQGELGRLRTALDDVQSQNTMLQDELTLLSNVKVELEAELERVKEDFQVEKEELEFKINELQMNKDSPTTEPELKLQSEQQKVKTPIEMSSSDLNLNEELTARCEALTRERNDAMAECQQMRDILQSVETELGEKTKDFVQQYNAMKEKGAETVRDLQEKIEQLAQQRDELRVRMTEITEEKNSLMKNIQDLQQNYSSESQKPYTSAEEEETSLKQAVKELTTQNEEIFSQLKMKENTIQDLKEIAAILTEERDKAQHLLKLKEDEVQSLNDSKTKEIESLLQEKERETLLLRDDNNKQHLKEEKEKTEENLKEKTLIYEETVSGLELRIKELSTERDDLHQKQEQALLELSKLQEDGKLMASKMADLEAHMAQRESEKQKLEEKVKSLTEEAEKSGASMRLLEENQSEVLRKSTEELEDLQTRVEELENEKNLLKRSLEGMEAEKRQEEIQTDFQARITDLEKERNMLTSNLNDVVKDVEGLQSDLQDIKSVNEKISDENQKLLAQASLAQEEREEWETKLGEKDALVSQLRNEITALQVVKHFLLLLPSALLEDKIKEKDEKMNKIKAVAVKAKKELDNSKKEVVRILSSHLCKCCHDKTLFTNSDGRLLNKETLSSEKEDLQAGLETMRSAVKQLEARNQELQKQLASLDRDLLAERAMKDQKLKVDINTHRSLKGQCYESSIQIEAQQSSLMDMEMADYERLVKELNGKLTEKDECVEELKSQINTLNQTQETHKQKIEALKSQLDQEEEKTMKMKQLLVKTKKDLADAMKQESSLMMQQASLKGELEANQQQLESSKIEMCELTAERHRLQEQLKSALEQQQRTSSSLQQRIHSLQQDRDTAKAELMATTSEFESYKVRVHNVLKQQKSKTSAQPDGDSGKLEREQLSSQVEQLRSRLSESQQNLQSCVAELQQLQAEHDTLLERHNKILQENITKEAELRERVLTLQTENVLLRSEVTQAQADLSSQVEAQRQTYREQLRKLQDDHRATVETLQGQLSRVEEQLFNLQSQNSKLRLGSMGLNDLQSMAREEGEGMETMDTERSSPKSAAPPSLEQLLTSPDPKQEPFVWTVEPSKSELTEKLSTATRSMEHMNGLLHETEATNAVLMEQITLLKSEVRRLERNQEREKSVANLEYLKNVLLQFIFLRSGSERQALLPVIHTMLQLSPEEKSKLAAIAQGEEEGSGSRGSGWTSYLHSWSGIR